MARQFAFMIVLALAVVSARGQAVHYLHCVDVTDQGGVNLYWEPAGSQAEFVAYRVFHRVPPGGFFQVATISDYGTTTYFHDITVANQQSVQYFIHTEQVASPGIYSDTLSSMHLTVTLNSADPIIALLNWNPLHADPLPGFNGYYYIYVHGTGSDDFVLVDSTVLTQFTLPVEVCRDTLFFRIEAGAAGCISRSNTASLFFEDITPPPMPVLDSVSIDPFTGEAILGWSPSPAGDAAGYVIYHVKPSLNDTLYWIPGRDSTFCRDLSFDPCAGNRSYAISAYDSCGNISPGSYDIPQRTIWLEDVAFDPCMMVNTLNWTEYINMEPPLEGYRIYCAVDGGAFSILGTVAAGITTFDHTGLDTGRNYSYFVRAFSAGLEVTSSSCIRERNTWQYRQPVDNRLGNASVEESAYVTLTLLPDTFAWVPFLNIYRADDASGPFELLEELALSGEEQLFYDDLTAEVNSRSYYYRTTLTDSCGNEVLPSPTLRTILLEGMKGQGQYNELSWNAFEGWSAGVEAYEVYRAVDDDGSFVLTGQTSATVLSYQDDISALSAGLSRLSYIVRAVAAGNAGLYSQSNVILIEYTPELILPNAFTPGGRNPVYRPAGSFAAFSEYRMDIYNRWGEMIFSSPDFGLGWDGTLDGGDAPAGVYVCVLSYRSTAGENTVLKSTFVLIR
jgi:gliding motility-associated-like protein